MANPKPTNPLKPLSVGDVVSSGVKLYRSRFSMYLKLSLVAYLWVLLPIYGWAKFAEITGRMSRLAFADFVGQPESPEAATRKTSPKKWRFFDRGNSYGFDLLRFFYWRSNNFGNRHFSLE